MPYNTPFPPGEYAVYLRKSRKDLELEARGEEDTLAQHHRILTRYAETHGLQIGEHYREVRSGDSIADRPEMQRLLRDVEAGRWRGVLVMEVERLARGDSIDQGIVARAFKYSETLIVTTSTVFDPTNEYDEESFEFNLFMARREYKTIRRRMVTGMQAAKREGRYLGNKPPYGYERYKLQGRGWSLRPIPEQAEVVRLIYNLYLSGLGAVKIVQELNARRIPAPGGERWAYGTIPGILRNPHYAGLIPHGMRPAKKQVKDGKLVESRPRQKNVPLYDGLHEAIIPKKQWEAVQLCLNSNAALRAPRAPHSKGLHNPLVGLLVCDNCGRRMQRHAASGTASHDSYACPTPGCETVSHNCEEIERMVIEALHTFLASLRLGAHAAPALSAASEEKALTALNARLQTVDARLSRAFELVEDGTYSKEVFRARQASLQTERAEILSERSELQARIEQIQRENDIRASLAPNIKLLLDAYDTNAPALERNRMLKSVLASIDYHKRTRLRWHAPSDLRITLHPRLSPDSL